LKIRQTFRSRRAYEEAHRRDPAQRGRGDDLAARRLSENPAAMTMDYEVRVSAKFLAEPAELILYGDGRSVLVPLGR
jgi:hypothetical protein